VGKGTKPRSSGRRIRHRTAVTSDRLYGRKRKGEEMGPRKATTRVVGELVLKRKTFRGVEFGFRDGRDLPKGLAGEMTMRGRTDAMENWGGPDWG